MSNNNVVENENLDQVSGGTGNFRVVAHAVCANCGVTLKDFFSEAEIDAWRRSTHTCNNCHSTRFEIRHI